MSTTAKTKALAAEEADRDRQVDEDNKNSTEKFTKQETTLVKQSDGKYHVQWIECLFDVVAIAPFSVEEISPGGISLVGKTVDKADTGIIVGTSREAKRD